MPGGRVERRGAIQRHAQPARKALTCGNANAHARERPGTATNQHLVHVRHGKARTAKALKGRGGQLDVGLAAAEVVARRKHAHG